MAVKTRAEIEAMKEAAKKRATSATAKKAALKEKIKTPVQTPETVYHSKFGPRQMPNTPKPKAPSNMDKVKGVAGKAVKVIKKVPGGGAALKAGKFVVGGKASAGLIGASLVHSALSNPPKSGKTTGGAGGSGRGAGSAGRKPVSKVFTQPMTLAGRVKVVAPKKAAASASTTKYRVETGDTLSGIAARAGVTLAELRAANPQLAGKGIFRNTGVNIPKKGKKPTPEYTGPVPFRPGSAAAKKYEASRKKK